MFLVSHAVVSYLLHGVEVQFGVVVLESTSAGYRDCKSSQTILHLWDAPPRVDVDRFHVLVVVFRGDGQMDRKMGAFLGDDLKDEKTSPPSMATTVLSWASSESELLRARRHF